MGRVIWRAADVVVRGVMRVQRRVAAVRAAWRELGEWFHG
jgi:hypothetical protein